MHKTKINDVLSRQSFFFSSGRTRDISFRKEQLKRLRATVVGREREIYDALQKDLGKPELESYIGEFAIVVREIDYAMRHIDSWSRPRRVGVPLAFFPAINYVLPEPYGVVLIIGTWNFPIHLTLVPLIGAIAAGNCVVLKPSPVAPASSALVTRIIEETFDPAFVASIEGGAETAQALLEEKFDYIFFTGSPNTGRAVMSAAARHLTPVTLELGGKNPCIVDFEVNIETAARKIVWGKFLNAGQSCVAVDYLLVHRDIKDALCARLVRLTRDFYGDDPSKSPDYCRIVSEQHVDRLARFIAGGKVLIGGDVDKKARYVGPTIMADVTWESPVMQEEIFGPVLPVLEYENLDEVISKINSMPHPLALYFFSLNRNKQRRVLYETSSGGVCINETVLHQPTTTLPFGGRGESGIGKYHGKASFETFSNMKAVTKNSLRLDFSFRYPPYRNKLALIRRFF